MMNQYEGYIKAIEYLYPTSNRNIPKRAETPLFTALQRNDLALAKLLLDHGADVNTPDLSGCPPLVYAVQCGNSQMAELLLQYKARVNVVDGQGMTPLGYAVKVNWKGHFVKLLLENGANPNYRG